MKTIVRILIAIILVLVIVVVVVGPGKIVAGVEYPFGIGPWSSNGRYCHDVYAMTHVVDVWNHAGHTSLTPTEKAALAAYEKTVTKTGPEVPRADFTSFFRRTGKNIVKRMTSEGTLINTWWNQNCADPLMEAPASANRMMAGFVSHQTFTHYPKNVVNVEFFNRALAS